MPPLVRQTVVMPLGLVTTPNQMGQYPVGALSVADNVRMTSPGMLTQIPGPGPSISFGTAGYSVRRIMPLDQGYLITFATNGVNWQVYAGRLSISAAACTFPVTNDAVLFSEARIFPTRSRDRMQVSSSRGCLTLDDMTPSSAPERTFRRSGLPQPVVAYSTSFASSPPPPVPNGVSVAYRVIITRESSDGYILKSSPSPRQIFLTPVSLSPLGLEITAIVSSLSDYVAGDFVEIYRTDGLPQSTTNSDPGSTLKLVKRYQLTSVDIAAGFKNITDRAVITAPYYTTYGRELYTNPGQEGELNADRQPDIYGTGAVFKGYTFSANVTERPLFEFSFPGSVTPQSGALAAYDPYRTSGIGARSITGTTTIASPTITGISATHIVGLVPGQIVSGVGIPNVPTTTITAVGATTVTMSANATAAGTVTISSFDVYELDGNTRSIFSGFASILSALAEVNSTNSSMVLSGDQASNPLQDTAGFSAAWEARLPSQSTLTIRATNGANWSPPVPEISAPALVVGQTRRPNLLRWSKDSEPEHWPSINETLVGSGTVIALVDTKDALWIFCTDGLFRLTGDAGVWRVDIVDPKCVLSAPYAACDLREVVYAYTSRGFVRVDDSGVSPLSRGRIEELLPGPQFLETAQIHIAANEANNEVWLVTALASTQTGYVYAADTDCFTMLRSFSYGNLGAMAWQASVDATSTPGRLVLSTGTSASVFAFATTAFWLAATTQYQPVFDGDPMLLKQWVDMVGMLSTNAAGVTLTGTVASGVTAGASTARLVSPVDCNFLVGVPRSHALTPSITPGIDLPLNATAAPFSIRGLSLRYCPLTNQTSRGI